MELFPVEGPFAIHRDEREVRVSAGADADLALVAMDREWTLEAEQLQARSGLSPYVGRSFRGAVVRTLVRGVTVFDDGEFVEEKRYVRFGRLVRRMDA